MTFTAYAANADIDTVDFDTAILDNGATMIVKHVPDSSLVTIQVRVLSGLSNEGRYAGTGVSHFLEHLLFKGTTKMGAEEIRREIKSMGGSVNGSTGLDSAEYHITVPNENFEKALNLLVDMVTQLVFTDEQIENEKEIILKEIRLNNDTPAKKRSRMLFAQAYADNVYKYPITGYEETFNELTREDVSNYHSAVYTPDRMVLGITGGVDPEKAMVIAKEKMKGYERGRSWRAVVEEEPRQISEKISKFPADVGLGYLAIAFHTTSVYSPDMYATDVLALLLGGGNDSRLYTRLVKDKELLYTVSSINYTPRYPGLFIVTGVAEPDKIDAAREEIFAVIEEFASSKIRPQEVERAKKMVLGEYLRAHERITSVNSSMTSSQLLVGDPGFYKSYVDEVQSVEKEEMGAMAAKYLNRDSSTTVMLLPENYLEKVERERDKREKRTGEERTLTLDNGLRIIVKKREQLPLVSVTLAAPGGVRAETEKNNGISNLTATLMMKGTKKRSEWNIVPEIEKMGGRIIAFSGMNSMGITMSLMRGDLNDGLDIFEDVIKNSVFPEKEIEKQKKKIIAAIKEQEKNIFENGMRYLIRELYGNHPYSMRTIGEIQTVQPLTRDDISTFYREHLVPGNSVITVVGDIDVGWTLKNIAKRFERWQGEALEPQKKIVASLQQIKQEDIVMYKEQSLLLVGFQGVEVTDKKRYALSIISSLLSGTDGLLFHTAREEKGLTYASGAVSIPQVDRGYFVFYIATTEERIGEAKKTVMEVLKKVSAGRISDEDIEASKNRLISQQALSLEANSAVAMTMTLDELYGLGADNYQKYSGEMKAVTRDDIIKAATETFDLEKYAVVVVHSER